MKSAVLLVQWVSVWKCVWCPCFATCFIKRVQGCWSKQVHSGVCRCSMPCSCNLNALYEPAVQLCYNLVARACATLYVAKCDAVCTTCLVETSLIGMLCYLINSVVDSDLSSNQDLSVLISWWLRSKKLLKNDGTSEYASLPIQLAALLMVWRMIRLGSIVSCRARVTSHSN